MLVNFSWIVFSSYLLHYFFTVSWKDYVKNQIKMAYFQVQTNFLESGTEEDFIF